MSSFVTINASFPVVPAKIKKKPIITTVTETKFQIILNRQNPSLIKDNSFCILYQKNFCKQMIKMMTKNCDTLIKRRVEWMIKKGKNVSD